MHTPGISTNLIKGLRGAQRRPLRLLAMLSLLVVMAASCSSDTLTAADDTGADDQSSVTTAAPEVATTTTAEPEPEPVVEDETNPAPDADVVAFTEAWGAANTDTAWSYYSPRCGGTEPVPAGFSDVVDGYAADYPGATAVNIVAVLGDSDTATISYDVHDDSGELAEAYNSQPWVFADGKWHQDAC